MYAKIKDYRGRYKNKVVKTLVRRKPYARQLTSGFVSALGSENQLAIKMTPDEQEQVLFSTLELGPLAVMPCQMVHRNFTPEQELMEALIRQAIHESLFAGRLISQGTWTDKSIRVRQSWLVLDALGWIFSDGQEPWSFEWCCDAVHMDPRKIRDHVEEQLPLATRVRRAMHYSEAPDLLTASVERPRLGRPPSDAQPRRPSAQGSC